MHKIEDKFLIPPKDRDYQLVMTNGCFDCGLTAAHVRYLQRARSMGNRLLVAINTDASCTRLKGLGRPIMPLLDRMYVVAALQSVDYVCSFGDSPDENDTPLELIKRIMPSVVVKGGDYKAEDVSGYGIVPVIIVDKFETISTTEKLDKMAKLGIKL